MFDKKKLLILIEWFSPGYKAGGPIRSCVNLCVALKELFDIYVLTTDTDHGETGPYENIIAGQWIKDNATGVQVFYSKKKALSVRQLAKEINKVDPDFIYLNLLFSPHFVLFPLWLKFSRKIHAKLILSPRGTLYDSALSLGRYKKKPLILLLKGMGIHRQITFHATNQREENAIKQYFPGSKIIIADNLPNMLQPAFLSFPKVAGSLRCIFIARIVPIKNLLFLLQQLKAVSQKIELTIVGPVEDETYWGECKQAIASLPGTVQVVYEGPKQNNQLTGLLQHHHLFILPTTGENFGHSIFESLLAGRPVLISDQTPWHDLAENKAGWAIPLTDPGKYSGIIDQLAGYNQEEFDQFAQAAWNYADRFIHKPGLIEKYKALFY